MTNRERFCEAFAHISHRVMGRWMEPFSLRHRFWLEAMESPLVVGGVATLVDLELAARVCAIPTDKLDRQVPRLLARGPSWLDRWRFCARALRGRVDREYEAIQNYFMDYGCPPSTHGSGPVTESGKRYESMPGILGLVTGLIRCGVWDPERVWALNPGAAEWYLAGLLAHRGVDVRIKTEQDEEFEAGLRAELAEKRARERLRKQEEAAVQAALKRAPLAQG